MTTVIIYKNKMAADRNVLIDIPSGTPYYDKVDSKIYHSECKRAAFVFLFQQIKKDNIPTIIDAFINAFINMKMGDSYPTIQLTDSVLKSLGKNISVYIAIKDEIYFFAKLDDYKINKGLNTLLVYKLDTDIFLSNGSGECYALGIHKADPSIPIGEIIERVSQLDYATSKEHAVVDCTKLKPLYKVASIGRKKND